MLISARVVSDDLKAEPKWVVLDTVTQDIDIKMQWRYQHDAEYLVLEDPSFHWRQLAKTIMVG